MTGIIRYRLLTLLAGASLLAAPLPARAQEAAGAGERDATGLNAAPAGRFTMQPVDGGMLKLDTQTGGMSFCSSRAGQWRCEALPDERAALETEIDRLQKRLAARQGGVPDIMAPPLPPPASPGTPPAQEGPPRAGRVPDAGQPTEPPAETRRRLDEAMEMAEHVFRRFFDMIDRLRRDPPKGEDAL